MTFVGDPPRRPLPDPAQAGRLPRSNGCLLLVSVTFQMVMLSSQCRQARDNEVTGCFSPGTGWRSCHPLLWDSTMKSTRGCEGQRSRLRLRLDSTTHSTRGFDGPRSCPAPLQAPWSHMSIPPNEFNSHLDCSHVGIRTYGAVAVPSTVGLRMRITPRKPWETAHKQGM